MPHSRRQMLKRLGALGATPVVAGCLGDGGTTATGSPAGGDTPTGTTEGTATPVDAQSKYPNYSWGQLDGVDPVATTTITMEGFAFHPLVAEVPPGTELSVTNEDSGSHTMTVPALGIEETLTAGGSTTMTVEKRGTFDYLCEFHPPDMVGRLVVSEDAVTPTDDGMGTDSPTATAAAGPAVQVRDHDDLGDILVGPEGMTLYMFDSDTQGSGASACTGGCASAWPPLTVDGEPTAGDGVSADLTTFERGDGDTQVAANGWPLYYYASDGSPGDAMGQGANGVWWVLRPDGTPVRSSGGTATPTPTGTSTPTDTGASGPGGDY